MEKGILAALSAALFFGVWPIFSKLSGQNGALANFVIIAVTFVVISGIFIFNGMPAPQATAGRPVFAVVGFLLVAGLLNALGWASARYMFESPIEISELVMIMSIGIPVSAMLFGALIMKEPITWSKVAAAGLGGIAIWLISK